MADPSLRRIRRIALSKGRAFAYESAGLASPPRPGGAGVPTVLGAARPDGRGRDSRSVGHWLRQSVPFVSGLASCSFGGTGAGGAAQGMEVGSERSELC